jgi:uncharacterized protein (UPF0276 family)
MWSSRRHPTGGHRSQPQAAEHHLVRQGRREIDPLTLQVSATDHEVIDVYAYTSRLEVEWVLEVSYTSAGKDGILRIDDHGKPFRLTALDNAVGYLYAGGPAGLERDPDLDRQAREGELVC